MICQTRHARLRALVAGVMTLLFVVQIAFLQVSPLRSTVEATGAGPAVAASIVDEICHTDGGAAPGEDKNAPCSHCVLCGSASRLDAALLLPLRVAILLTLVPAPASPTSWALETPLAPRPLGWTSSWSSRAPPYFS